MKAMQLRRHLLEVGDGGGGGEGGTERGHHRFCGMVGPVRVK